MAPLIMNNLKLLFISFISAFSAMFQFGYLAAVINPAQDSLTVFINNSNYDNRDKYLSSDKFNWVYSFIVNCYQIGFLIGTILTPLSVERFGRKWSLISTGAFDLIGSVVQVAAFPLELPSLLAAGRVIAGIGSGLGCGAVTLYIQEISPTNIRGLLSSFQAISNNLTTLLGMVLGLPSVLGSVELLPYLMAVSAIPGFLKLILILCPETPKYLLLKRDKINDARYSIAYYHGRNAEIESVLAEIRKEGDLDNEKIVSDDGSESNVESWKLIQIMKTPHLRKALILGSVTFAALNSTGLVPLTEFSTYLLQDLNVQLQLALLVGILIGVCFTLTSILSLLLVEISGRKNLLMIGFVSIIILLILLMVCYIVGPDVQWAGYLACVVIICHVGFFGIGPGTIPWYITAELVPSSVRSTAQSFTQVVNVLFNFAFSFAFLPLFAFWGPYSILALFIIPTIILVIYLYFELPETKNREIADIVADLKKKSKKDRINKL